MLWLIAILGRDCNARRADRILADAPVRFCRANCVDAVSRWSVACNPVLTSATFLAAPTHRQESGCMECNRYVILRTCLFALQHTKGACLSGILSQTFQGRPSGAAFFLVCAFDVAKSAHWSFVLWRGQGQAAIVREQGTACGIKAATIAPSTKNITIADDAVAAPDVKAREPGPVRRGQATCAQSLPRSVQICWRRLRLVPLRWPPRRQPWRRPTAAGMVALSW